MSSSSSTLTAHAPVLLIRDVVASEKYYREILGFERVGFFGEPPTFCILKRDELYLMLSQVPEGHEIVPHWRVVSNMPSAYFWVDDVDALYREFKSAGAKIDFELCDQPYGCREFGIQDLDEHDISFGQVIEES